MIKFTTRESADKAVKGLNGKMLNGETSEVSLSFKNVDEGVKIFVGGPPRKFKDLRIRLVVTDYETGLMNAFRFFPNPALHITFLPSHFKFPLAHLLIFKHVRLLFLNFLISLLNLILFL
jgi:RNA recognition motif-containing protein